METARHRLRGGAPPMGVSFHQAGRRFEGRESATTNLTPLWKPAAEPNLNGAFSQKDTFGQSFMAQLVMAPEAARSCTSSGEKPQSPRATWS